MHLKMTFLVLILLLINRPSFSQTVSTLINDSSKAFEAIHWHSDGRIYVVDYTNGRLYQAFTDGTIETLVTGVPYMTGGGFGNDGTFYFSDLANGRIYSIDEDANQTLIASGLSQPTGILATSSPDTLLVAQYNLNSVVKVSISAGTKTTWVSGNGIDGPDGILEIEDGKFLIANFDNPKIHLVDTDNSVELFATIPSAGTMGYIAQVDDHIYVPSIAGGKIYKVTMDGAVSVLAGSGSSGNVDGEGIAASFSNPNGIVRSPSGDTLLITDGSRIRLITNFAETVSKTKTPIVNQLKVSPNPTSDLLRVSFEAEDATDSKWQILNQQGQVVMNDAVTNIAQGKNELQLSLEHLSSGIYTFQLVEGNREVARVQFVITK